jgi:hypothetical protein
MVNDDTIVFVVPCVRAKVVHSTAKETVVIIFTITSCDVLRNSSHAERFKHKWHTT